jgi:hypothetical protein
MATTIKQILEWPVGQKSGGFVLVAKTAKKKWNVGEIWYQRVMFADAQGDEIFGEIILNGNVSVMRNTPLRIIICKRVVLDVNNRDVPAILVEQWKDDRPVMSEPDILDDFDKWQIARQEEIKGKIRHGLVCVARRKLEYKGPLSKMHKEFINSDVDFIMKGE